MIPFLCARLIKFCDAALVLFNRAGYVNGLSVLTESCLSDFAQRERITLFNTAFALHWEPADLIKDQVTNGALCQCGCAGSMNKSHRHPARQGHAKGAVITAGAAFGHVLIHVCATRKVSA